MIFVISHYSFDLKICRGRVFKALNYDIDGNKSSTNFYLSVP